MKGCWENLMREVVTRTSPGRREVGVMLKAVVTKPTDRGKVCKVSGRHKALGRRCYTAGVAVAVMGFDGHSQLLAFCGCEPAHLG